MNTATQIQLDLSRLITSSPINTHKLTGQNRRLIDYLLIDGNRIHCMHPNMSELQIGYLNSRIADLRKFLRYENMKIEQQRIQINGTTVCEYWISKTA